jgi:type IV pilus biogenesis protein CpaD/CtpE
MNPTMKHRLPTLLLLGTAFVLLAGCAHRGSRSPDARPVLYPNAAYKQMGEERAQDELELCIASAQRAGLTPDEKDNAVGHGAAKGAAVVGTVATVGSLVRGRSVDSAVTAGARGAAVGAAGGAVAGAFNEKPNMTYRHFVQRCASEKGLEVIGWQ